MSGAALGTLESRLADRLAEFGRMAEDIARRRERAAADPAADPATEAELARREREVAEAEVEYLLDAVPFIREHSSTTRVEDPKHAAAAAGSLGSFVAVTHKSSRNNVLQRYLMHVEKQVDATTMAAAAAHEDSAAKRNPREAEYFCEACDAGMVFHARESLLVCSLCGTCRSFTEMSASNLTYEQEVHQDVVTYFAYKRLNHFCEWLNSLQAKENTEIPAAVVEAVKAEFKKTRATTRAEIKPTKVREFLKKLKLNKYYEHTNAICNILNGVPAPKLPAALEEKLKAMFAEIQQPFERNCPPHRKNFLSYGYTLYKFCELLGEDEYLQYFPLLKSNEKLYAQDQIWRKICRDLRWEYIPSV